MKKILFISLILISFTAAQPADSLLSGNLQADSRYLLSQLESKQPPVVLLQVQNKKSPFLAGFFSLVLPGAGEFYTGDYWKAAIFVALEAALITTAVVYDNKGDNKTGEFQQYADDYKNPAHNWNVVKYSQWIIDNKLAG